MAFAAAACTASPRFRDAYFNALFAEHCLRVDRAADPAEVSELQLRLANVSQRAAATGMADDVRAAEDRWADFAARAEFVCEVGAADRLREQIEQLVDIM